MIHARFKLARADFTLDVDTHFPSTGITALFGPSGSGKTTLLRCIAGLERADGLLQINNETWQDDSRFVPTHQRPLGYVFQEASLFPHLSVRANLEYGYRRIKPTDCRVPLEQVIEWLGLANLLGRLDTHSLSGGERQRVAIGRALAASPRILLMDEPLAALDTSSRWEILPYLERLHRELMIPVIYVSHALDEVARLADHLLLLQTGRIIASGTLGETLARLDLPTAHLDDAGVVIEAIVALHDEAYQLSRLDFLGGNLWVGHVPQAIGSKVRARVMARDVSINTVMPHGSSISNILAACISEIRDEGSDKVLVRMTIGESAVFLSRITRRSRDLLNLTIGMNVFAQVKSVVLTT
jgi:molybdate transport system ATP-binding protein